MSEPNSSLRRTLSAVGTGLFVAAVGLGQLRHFGSFSLSSGCPETGACDFNHLVSCSVDGTCDSVGPLYNASCSVDPNGLCDCDTASSKRGSSAKIGCDASAEINVSGHRQFVQGHYDCTCDGGCTQTTPAINVDCRG
jgi:hypothetical protein